MQAKGPLHGARAVQQLVALLRGRGLAAAGGARSSEGSERALAWAGPQHQRYDLADELPPEQGRVVVRVERGQSDGAHF